MLPYPLLWFALTVMWIMLNGFSLGHLVLGSIIATFACWSMASLRPSKPKVQNWHLIPGIVGTILLDIARSNLAVAWLILRGKRGKHASGFVRVPLELNDPVGLAILAIVLTSTPGSAWLEYNSGSKSLLMHVLDLKDEQEWVDLVKNRYEARLVRIFGALPEPA